MKKCLLAITALFCSVLSFGQTDWSSRTANIIYSKCSSCHNLNGIAPFSLMSYSDAVDNASDIKDAVQNQSMPPWPPDPAYNRLAHERVLTAQEIADIADWVDGGTPVSYTHLTLPTSDLV